MQLCFRYGGLCERRDNAEFNTSTDLWRLCLVDNTWKRIPLKEEVYYFSPVSYACKLIIRSCESLILRLTFSGIATQKWGLLTFGGTGYPFGQTISEKLCHLTIKNVNNGIEYNIAPFISFGQGPPASYGGGLS